MMGCPRSRGAVDAEVPPAALCKPWDVMGLSDGLDLPDWGTVAITESEDVFDIPYRVTTAAERLAVAFVATVAHLESLRPGHGTVSRSLGCRRRGPPTCIQCGTVWDGDAFARSCASDERCRRGTRTAPSGAVLVRSRPISQCARTCATRAGSRENPVKESDALRVGCQPTPTSTTELRQVPTRPTPW